MLTLQPPERLRIPLADGAVAVLDPVSSLSWLKAQGMARAARAAVEEADASAASRFAMIASLIHSGLREVEGVADIDGAPITGQPSEDQIDRLLAWFPAYEALEQGYAGPILEAQAEKNAFAPSRGGSSTPRAVTPTAEAARPAKPANGDAASAPKGRTRRKRSKA
jgi:hypothetical protein